MNYVLVFTAGCLTGQLAMIVRHSFGCWRSGKKNRIQIVFRGDARELDKALAVASSQVASYLRRAGR